MFGHGRGRASNFPGVMMSLLVSSYGFILSHDQSCQPMVIKDSFCVCPLEGDKLCGNWGKGRKRRKSWNTLIMKQWSSCEIAGQVVSKILMWFSTMRWIRWLFKSFYKKEVMILCISWCTKTLLKSKLTFLSILLHGQDVQRDWNCVCPSPTMCKK